MREEWTGRRVRGIEGVTLNILNIVLVQYSTVDIILKLLSSVHTVQYVDFSLQVNDTFLWSLTVNVYAKIGFTHNNYR